MNEENQKIIQKIKRCLALSKSSNENEAATALRQAHAMMAKYNLCVEDIKATDIKESPSKTTATKAPNVYMAALAQMIARLFGCTFFISRDLVYKNGKAQWRGNWVFFGLDGYVEIASYAFDTLCRQLKKARNDYMKTELSLVRIKKNKYARADAFCYGWVASVREKVAALVPPKVDMAFIEYQFKKTHNATKKTEPKNSLKNTSRSLITNDYYNGAAEGRNAQLHHAMNGRDESYTAIALEPK